MANKKQPPFNPFRVFLVGLVLFISIVFLNLANNENLQEISNMEKRIEMMDQKIGELQAENDQLRTKIISINKDDYLIEKVAREELGLVKSGEIVYKMYN